MPFAKPDASAFEVRFLERKKRANMTGSLMCPESPAPMTVRYAGSPYSSTRVLYTPMVAPNTVALSKSTPGLHAPPTGRVAPPTARVGESGWNGAGGRGGEAPKQRLTRSGGVSVRGSIFTDEFSVQDKIGAGSFGDVYRARWLLDDRMYAIKKIRRVYRGDGEVRTREADTLSALRGHPHILPLVRAWEEGGALYLQMGLCERNMNLHTLVHGYLSEDAIWRVAYDVAEGLRHMHSLNMVHNDLKLENILLYPLPSKGGYIGVSPEPRPKRRAGPGGITADTIMAPSHFQGERERERERERETEAEEGSVGEADQDPVVSAHSLIKYSLMLGDFGLSSAVALPLTESEGDIQYLAPETLGNGATAHTSGDMFSLGALLLELAGDVALPQSGKMWTAIRSVDPSQPGQTIDQYLPGDSPSRSPALFRFIERLMNPVASQRPSAAEVLQHARVSEAGAMDKAVALELAEVRNQVGG
eukprot:g4526.t1